MRLRAGAKAPRVRSVFDDELAVGMSRASFVPPDPRCVHGSWPIPCQVLRIVTCQSILVKLRKVLPVRAGLLLNLQHEDRDGSSGATAPAGGAGLAAVDAHLPAHRAGGE